MSAASSALSDAFSAFAARRGLSVRNGRIYGASRRYPFEAALTTRGKGVVCFFFKVDGLLSANALKELREQLGRGWSVGVVSSGTYSLTYNAARDKDGTPDLDGAVERMTAAFLEDQVAVPDLCPLCRKKGCDALARVEDKGFGPVHRSCMQDAAERLRPSAAAGSVLTGCTGALLGALVGLIPSVLTISLMGRIFALAYALIPICAFQGYKLFRGRMDHRAPLTAAVLSSLLGVLVLELGFCAWYAVDFYGELLSFSQLLDVYYAKYGLMELFKSLVFWAFGLWLAWGQISRTAGYAAQSIGSSLDTMTTLEGVPLSSGEQART